MTLLAHKYSLRISLAANIILLLGFLGLGALFVWQLWENAQKVDARPMGAVITLDADTRIVSGDAPTIYLPAGTILQESTPQGAATLGKIDHREYIMTIRTDNFQFTKNHPTVKNSEWITPYMFAGKK